MKFRVPVTALTLATLVPAVAISPRAPAQGRVEIRIGGSPTQDPRDDDMRRLARRLDERVSRTAERIATTARRSRAERRLLVDLEAFGDRTRSFADRLDRHDASSSAFGSEVASLDRGARALAASFEAVRPDARSEWRSVLELVDRMNSVLAERPGRGGGDDPGRPGYGHPDQGSQAARDLRGLAAELDEATSRARDKGEQIAGAGRGPARDPLNDIRALASRARDLRSRVESPQPQAPTLQPVDTRGLRPLAESVREVARQTERSARRAEVLRPVWSDLAAAGRILDRMVPLL